MACEPQNVYRWSKHIVRFMLVLFLLSIYDFETLYHASFIILHYDQQMHNYFTN